jgi:hypothetical protein
MRLQYPVQIPCDRRMPTAKTLHGKTSSHTQTCQSQPKHRAGPLHLQDGKSSNSNTNGNSIPASRTVFPFTNARTFWNPGNACPDICGECKERERDLEGLGWELDLDFGGEW